MLYTVLAADVFFICYHFHNWSSLSTLCFGIQLQKNNFIITLFSTICLLSVMFFGYTFLCTLWQEPFSRALTRLGQFSSLPLLIVVCLVWVQLLKTKKLIAYVICDVSLKRLNGQTFISFRLSLKFCQRVTGSATNSVQRFSRQIWVFGVQNWSKQDLCSQHFWRGSKLLFKIKTATFIITMFDVSCYHVSHEYLNIIPIQLRSLIIPKIIISARYDPAKTFNY